MLLMAISRRRFFRITVLPQLLTVIDRLQSHPTVYPCRPLRHHILLQSIHAARADRVRGGLIISYSSTVIGYRTQQLSRTVFLSLMSLALLTLRRVLQVAAVAGIAATIHLLLTSRHLAASAASNQELLQVLQPVANNEASKDGGAKLPSKEEIKKEEKKEVIRQRSRLFIRLVSRQSDMLEIIAK